MFDKFPFINQLNQNDCGPVCLKMIADYYDKNISLEKIKKNIDYQKSGVSLYSLSECAEKIGLKSINVKIDLKTLLNDVPMPCIAHWNQNHFIVIHKIKKNVIYIADPANGLMQLKKEEFIKYWVVNSKHEGVLLLLEDISDKKTETKNKNSDNKSSLFEMISFLKPYKRSVFQLLIGILFGSLIGLIFPFLTQAIVDNGIKYKDIDLIFALLLAQVFLFISKTSIDFIRSWLLLHIGTRLNISIISNYLINLMKLPMSFFDKHLVGDLLQKIQDHKRIEHFLTSISLNIVFSLFNLIIYSFVLLYYSVDILIIFLIGTVLQILWVFAFLKKRRDLDYKRFLDLSDNSSSVVQMLHGMQEIKLNNAENVKRWEWENLQAKLFKTKIKSLTIEQIQQAGALFINEIKNIIITFIAANEVVYGSMTLGMMLSVSYIIGQLNSPISHFITFFKAAQDAKLSFERMLEISNMQKEDEESNSDKKSLPKDKNIYFNNVSFAYTSNGFSLNNLKFKIPQGKVTAVVGYSGSGKTTLLKLLLKYYKLNNGNITIGGIDLEQFETNFWRKQCGSVMQDGFIFNDTIAQNIIMDLNQINEEKLIRTAKSANILEFIDTLPLKFNTTIGGEGLSLSQGQKQRVLIARALYKNSEYLFFDEATSSLDTVNENSIMNNLAKNYKGKTTLVIAHRLSTVVNADNILVMDKGKIVEQGVHIDLISKKGIYYNLIRNQLELGV